MRYRYRFLSSHETRRFATTLGLAGANVCQYEHEVEADLIDLQLELHAHEWARELGGSIIACIDKVT